MKIYFYTLQGLQRSHLTASVLNTNCGKWSLCDGRHSVPTSGFCGLSYCC